MFGGNGASTHFRAVQPTSGSFASSCRTSGENITIGSRAGLPAVGQAAQPVQAAPFVLDEDHVPSAQPRDQQRQQRRQNDALPGHDREVADDVARRSDRAPDLAKRALRL